MYFRHNLNIQYPERSDEHMIIVKHLRDTNFDENYKYYNKSAWEKFKRGILFILLNIIVFPIATFWYGLKIHGREILKKHKKEFKDGAITISNHVFMWDYICLLKVIRPHLQYLPAWKTNFEGPSGHLIKWIGGIPIPTGNVRAMMKFKKAIDEVLTDKKWVHFFPEGSMWFYYPDIRPLKKAVFSYAVEHNKPIIPISFSFRERKGITKFFTKIPFVDVNIGEPLLPDTKISDYDAIIKLHKQAYHSLQVLAGINVGDSNYRIEQNIESYIKTM